MSSPSTNESSQQEPAAQPAIGGRYVRLIAFMLFGAATTGYFIGLTSPMNSGQDLPSPAAAVLHNEHNKDHGPRSSRVIPATTYHEMSAIIRPYNPPKATLLTALKQPLRDPYTLPPVNEPEKLLSLAHRETRRAYNGAPPTVPHPIEQLNSAACMACHGEGLSSKSLRASKMPHPYYSNCTQCHVEKKATFASASATFENMFTGSQAPTKGSRAYEGAPPTIPHSTWMRNDCLSCHGRTAAPGMESTHPWRTSCLQCHAESSQLNQSDLNSSSEFLPPPDILNRNE